MTNVNDFITAERNAEGTVMTTQRKPRRTREQLRYRDGADECVRSNMGLIFSTIRRTCPWLAETLREFGSSLRDDLVAIGMVSIAKAHRDYDESKGYEFSTLATTYIRNDVLKAEKARKQRRRLIVVEIDDNRDVREMQPDVAAVTWETVRRRTTVSLFGDTTEGEA